MKKLLLLLILFTHVHGYHIGDDAYKATQALAHHPAILPSVLPELRPAAQQAFEGIHKAVQEVWAALNQPLSPHTHVLAHRFLSFYADLQPSTLAQWHRDAATAQLKALKRLTARITATTAIETDLPSLACQNSMLVANLRLAPWLDPSSYTKQAQSSRHLSAHSKPLYSGKTSLIPAAITLAAVVTATAFMMQKYAVPAKDTDTLDAAHTTADKDLAEFQSYKGQRLEGAYLRGDTVDPAQPKSYRFRRHALFVLQHLLQNPTPSLKQLSLEQRAELAVIPPIKHLSRLANQAEALEWLTTICPDADPADIKAHLLRTHALFVQQYIRANPSPEVTIIESEEERAELAADISVERLAELAEKAKAEKWLQRVCRSAVSLQQTGSESTTRRILHEMIITAQEAKDEAEAGTNLDTMIAEYIKYPRIAPEPGAIADMLRMYEHLNLQGKSSVLAWLMDNTILPRSENNKELKEALALAEAEHEEALEDKEETLCTKLAQWIKDRHRAITNGTEKVGGAIRVFALNDVDIPNISSEDPPSVGHLKRLAAKLGITTEEFEKQRARYDQELDYQRMSSYYTAVYLACGELDLELLIAKNTRTEDDQAIKDALQHNAYDQLITHLAHYPTVISNTSPLFTELGSILRQYIEREAQRPKRREMFLALRAALKKYEEDLLPYADEHPSSTMKKSLLLRLRQEEPHVTNIAILKKEMAQLQDTYKDYVEIPLDKKQFILGWLLKNKAAPMPSNPPEATPAAILSQAGSEASLPTITKGRPLAPITRPGLAANTREGEVGPGGSPMATPTKPPSSGGTPIGGSSALKLKEAPGTKSATHAAPVHTPISTSAIV